MVCNRHIRWEFLLNHALSLGASKLATGHYAQVIHQDNEPVRLLKGLDNQKDQSYVLSVLNQDQLQHALLPIGSYTKTEIRKFAKDINLPVADIKDSQDLCFLAGTDYANFLERHAPHTKNPGPITLSDGTFLGQHNGLAFYTIGQRKGLGIAAPTPLYVLRKDTRNNTLVVGTKDELGKNKLTAGAANWISGNTPSEPFYADIKTRYTSDFFPGKVIPLENSRFKVEFDASVPDITPGQAAVVYTGQEVIANGIIEDNSIATEPTTPVKIFSTGE
jgi:tRNA-specific 2-thiouridylase